MARSLLTGRFAVVAAVVTLCLMCAYLYQLRVDNDELQSPSLPQFSSETARAVVDTSIVEEPEQTPSPRRFRQDTSQTGDQTDMKFLRGLGEDTGLPTAEELAKLSDKELTYVYHSYLDNIDTVCRRKIRMGIVGDGGWEVCDDFEYRLMEPCTVYSFGIRDDFSFDDDIGKLYHCNVYSFDPRNVCSMSKQSHKRSRLVNFYNIGLRGDSQDLPIHIAKYASQKKWRLDSLTNLKEMLNHKDKTIDMIKMDIEHSEWLALPSMLAHNELKNVRQLLMEYHLYDTNPDYIRKNIHNLRALHDLGFRRFHSHQNPKCNPLPRHYPVIRTTCYEVYYLNINFARPSFQKPTA